MLLRQYQSFSNFENFDFENYPQGPPAAGVKNIFLVEGYAHFEIATMVKRI